jgi:hypothetical protein
MQYDGFRGAQPILPTHAPDMIRGYGVKHMPKSQWRRGFNKILNFKKEN